MAGEKVLELEDAARGMHEFLRGDARDGRFVHADRFGNIVQYQWLHGFFALLQETALVLNDLRSNLHQGFVAALQALDEPACLLQVIAQIGVVVTGVGATYHRRVLAVDPDFRH